MVQHHRVQSVVLHLHLWTQVLIKAPVGTSCGLITEGDRWMTMVDIQGVEDFFGDMDFKVGGTHKVLPQYRLI